MAVNAFLKIDGIVGDHKGEVQLESFSWGVSNPETACGGGGGGSGKPSFQDLSFRSRLGSQSLSLFLAAVTGRHIKDATLTVPGQIAVTFSSLIVSNYKEDLSFIKSSEGEASVPLEFVSFNFAKIHVKVGEATGGFDICSNRGL